MFPKIWHSKFNLLNTFFLKSLPDLDIFQQIYLSNLLSVNAFHSTFIIFLLPVSAITKACRNSLAIAFTFRINCRYFFFINTKSIYVEFSPILNVTFLNSSLLNHVFYAHIFFKDKIQITFFLTNSTELQHTHHKPHRIHQYAHQRVNQSHPSA